MQVYKKVDDEMKDNKIEKKGSDFFPFCFWSFFLSSWKGKGG